MCPQDLHQLIQSSPAGVSSHDPWGSQIQCNQISLLQQNNNNIHILKVKSNNIKLLALHNTFLETGYLKFLSYISSYLTHRPILILISKALELIAYV
jgi:hypothetical protein